MWRASKQLDGLSGEWTYDVFTQRAMTFQLFPERHLFYEPLQNFDTTALECILTRKLADWASPAAPLLHSVNIDLEAFPSIFDLDDNLCLRMPGPDEKSIGRHSLALIGVHDADHLICRSSWSGWTPTGWALVPRRYFEAHARDGYVARDARFGPTEETAAELLELEDKSRFLNLWVGGQADKTEVLRNHMTLRRTRTWSMQDESDAEILSLEREGVLLAWAIMHHEDGVETKTAVSDLFVWPPFRRKGIGSLLHKHIRRRARGRGSVVLEAYLWEADDVSDGIQARAFLRTCGYELGTPTDTAAVAVGLLAP
jgi:GNAT superfamily N-acetyltransferase